MAAVVTDTRIEIDDAEQLTDWTNPNGASSLTLFGVGQSGTTPTATEGDIHIGQPVSEETADIMHTLPSATNLANTLIYVWLLANGIMDTLTGTTENPGIGVLLNDGTNRISYALAGSDKAAFRHNNSAVGAQCLLLDTSDLPSTFIVFAGAEANLDIANITGIGAHFATLEKALGNVENCFTDIIRTGNDGLIITGTSGTWNEIALEDADSSAGKKYGIIHELGAGLYGLQGPLTFGDTGTVSFSDTDVTVVFENRGLGTDKYFINIVEGAAGGDHTSFTLGTKVGDQGGSNGCSIITSAGVGCTWDSSDTDVEFVLLYGSTFIGFEGGMIFSSDATNAPNHEIMACTFSGNGLITIGLTEFKNNNISASITENNQYPLASVLLDSTTNVSDLNFTMGSTDHHAILIDTTGTYTLKDFTYTNFATVDGEVGDEGLFNDSGGLVTLNISGGSAPTIRNGSGATTAIVNTKTIDFHVEDADGNDVEGAQVYIQKSSPTAQFSGAGNAAGDGDIVVSSTVDSDIPTTGWVIVYDKSENATQPYRYATVSGSTLTFPTSVIGTADSEGTNTQLLETGAFGSVEEGDTIRNTTDTGAWAVVDQKISANELLTTPLRGGTNNTWASGDGWSVHDLATALVQNVDTVDIPMANEQTESDGDIPTVSFSLGASIPVSIRIRSNEGATKYIPFVTSATISDNFAGSAVIQEDPVAI